MNIKTHTDFQFHDIRIYIHTFIHTKLIKYHSHCQTESVVLLLWALLYVTVAFLAV